MANGHYEKWIYKTTLGCILIAGAIFFIYYSLLHLPKEKWFLYALSSAIGVAIGSIFLSSAAVNKVKSDLIKKQKFRQQSE